MTQEEINEGNKLIAEWMGYESCGNQVGLEMFTSGGGDITFITDFKYHKDWNKLMLVVEKINAMTPEFKLPRDLQAMKERTHPFEKYADVLGMPVSSTINEVYKAVVQFIKWHNAHNDVTTEKP